MTRLFLLTLTAGWMMGVAAEAATLNTRLWINGKQNQTVMAGEPTQLDFEFWDSVTGDMAHHFHIMHAKPMHLIVVSEDLAHFAHVHPELREHSFRPFFLTANTVSADPDNFAMPTLIPFAGNYFLFAEAMPMNYGMLNFTYDLKAIGQEHLPVMPAVDPKDSEGKITKYFSSNGVETFESEATYQAKLAVSPLNHCEVIIPYLNFEISKKENEVFVPVTDLEPWLESYGHSIIISRKGNVAAEKTILHLHAVWPLTTGDVSQDERGPNVELAAHSHNGSAQTDQYRVWVQIKHQGKVLTLPFEIDWNLEEAEKTTGTNSRFCVSE